MTQSSTRVGVDERDVGWLWSWRQAENEREMETRTAVGLIKGHAYGITAIRRVNLKDTRLFAFLRYVWNTGSP